MIGLRIEMLVVEESLPGSRLLCRCDCGKKRIVKVGHFNTGKVKSCGCHVVRHGHGSNGKRSREYICYHNMIARCHNRSNKRYKDYGGRGIKVCEKWRSSFVSFLNDMGECPKGFTIDRIDNRFGYSPENCRWVSRTKNQANRSVSKVWVVDGERFLTMRDAANRFGVSTATIAARCKGRKAEGRYYPPSPGCYVEMVY